ncbi:MAG: hypothetical protein ACFE0Q_20395 [Anaerolineae bacterium]
MTQILAADNHIIQSKPGKWRLTYQERPLAEGSARGFRYSRSFGVTRRLPNTGIIEADHILQVVLGWQMTDESWHLGLILAPELAQKRGSRWCEVVHWPDPDITVFQDLAQTSGQELAQSIGVPFYVIPPKRATAPIITRRDLPPLPLRFGYWQMDVMRTPDNTPRYVITRRPSWRMQRIIKGAWYGFGSLVYLGLSVATLVSDIALPRTGTLLPNPQVLPYLGILISAGLVLMMLYQFALIFISINRVVIDSQERTISAWVGNRRNWSVSHVEIQSLYVSEVVKRRDEPPATEHGELSLHLGGGNFRFVIAQTEPHDNQNVPQPERVFSRKSDIRELTRDVAHTELQVAGLYIAEALGDVPVWHDLRVR